MINEKHEWADKNLSIDLPILREKGENQDLEFIESFPQNVRDLSKEIAAFATSNTGVILLGISNNGDLIGLQEATDVLGRDQLLRRVEGICRSAIKPAITPIAKFAIESERVVLILTVPKGSQPVYYSHQIPYVRHITESRPAEPHEVIELIRNHLATSFGNKQQQELNHKSKFHSELASILIDILIHNDEIEERQVNPWLEMWRANFKHAASKIRELTAEYVPGEDGLEKNLDALSEALDKAATFRLYLGCGPELDRLIKEVAELAQKLKKDIIDTIPLSEESISEIKELVRSTSRKLNNLASRSTQLIESGRIEELKAEASKLGYQLLKASYYDIKVLGQDFKQALRSIAKELHLIETVRLYMDGGQSLRKLLQKISQNSERLSNIIIQLR